jgi:hypothetical protein
VRVCSVDGPAYPCQPSRIHRPREEGSRREQDLHILAQPWILCLQPLISECSGEVMPGPARALMSTCTSQRPTVSRPSPSCLATVCAGGHRRSPCSGLIFFSMASSVPPEEGRHETRAVPPRNSPIEPPQ